MEKQTEIKSDLVLLLCVSVVDFIHKIHFSTVRTGKFHDISYCVPAVTLHSRDTERH